MAGLFLALLELGDHHQSATRLAAGLALRLPHFLGLLADQLTKTGCVERGLTTIARAIAIAEHTAESYSLAYLYRISNELSMQNGAASEAELQNSIQAQSNL